ncbi:MAG: hypothetical protein ABIS50_11915 [Luteolibacter sp.]|uniref:hypothetical protein n=1 Tax=Luteolibacter sp. TaxID=1962973 RepID=UPI0032642054
MNKEALSWISAYSKEVYGSYSKIDSFQDRFRNLIPLYAFLGTGYFYVGTKFPHYYSDGNLAFFYGPFSAGLLLLLVSLTLHLYAMFWMAHLEIMPDPQEVVDVCSKMPMDYPEGGIHSYLEEQAAKRRCGIASRNLSLLRKRGELLNSASKVGVLSVLLLLVASPRFISTRYHESKKVSQGQTSSQP